MSLKKILLVISLGITYFVINYAFLSTESYSSMKIILVLQRMNLVMRLKILFMKKNGQDFTLR